MPGGVVLDPFTGSGSTGVAAVEQGHPFVGVEVTEHYQQVAADRLAQATPAEPGHAVLDSGVGDQVAAVLQSRTVLDRPRPYPLG